jgi:hypothetical protein
MTTAAEMLRRWKKLDIIQLTGEAIEQTREEAIRLNQDQLLHGEKADGTNLKPYRNLNYALKKNQMNPLPVFRVADARLTGELYKGMFVDIRSSTVVFDSTSPHATFMIERDGPTIFGLQPKNKELYAESYMPVVCRLIKQQTGTI